MIMSLPYQFMKEGLPYLSTYCQIYVTDALKGLSQSQAMHISSWSSYQPWAFIYEY